MSDKIVRVLSIEDNLGDANLIQAILLEASHLGWDMPRFEIQHIDRLAAALAYLDAVAAGKRDAIDVVLSDLDLPDSRAGETFAAVHAHAPDIPIVVLTGRDDEVLARQTVRAGAEDYLFKRELSGSLLAHALIYAIERRQNKRALQTAHDELERRVERRTQELRRANKELKAEIAERQRAEAERKAALDALRISEEKYRGLVEQSLQGLVIAQDDPVRIVFASKPMQAITGYSPQELTSFNPQELADLIHPAHRQIFFQNFRDRLQGKPVPHRREYQVIRKSGEICWVEVYSSWIEYGGTPATQTLFLDITERKRTEKALRESEARFRTLVNVLPQFVAYTDAELKYRFVNQTYQEKFNLAPNDVLGKTLLEVIGQEAFERARPHVERVLQGERVRYHECYEYAQGGTRHIDGTLLPDVDEDGMVRGYYAVLTDITPYMEMQHTLREREEQYRLVSELTSDFSYVVEIEPDGTYTSEWTAKSLKSFTGYSREEMNKGGGWKSLIYPDDLEIAQRHLEALFSGRPDNLEFRILAKNGEIRWLYNQGHSVWDETAGRVVKIFGAAQDITARKEVEEALRTLELKYRCVIDNSLAGIFIVQDGRFVFVNSRMADLVGCERVEELEGRLFWELVHPDDREWVKERGLRRESGLPEPAQYEFKGLKIDGSAMWVKVRATLAEYQGRPAIVGNILDIT